MQPVVTIFILAYNAEKYIKATIESVLSQNESNIECVIRDNGSTDSTYEIIEKYAEKDKRIRVIRNKNNHKNDDGTPLRLDQYCPEPRGEYFTYLDSDDLLKEDYVSTLYKEAKRFDADVVIAGTTMFEDASGRELADRIPPAFVFHAGENLGNEDFENVYGSLRPLWGKLFRTDFFEDYALEAWKAIEGTIAGGDTIFSLLFINKANCIVSVAKSLHMYRVKKQGHYRSSVPDIRRVYDGECLFLWAVKVLPHLGINPNDVYEFLYRVYLEHLHDLLMMCNESLEMDLDRKYAFIERILTSSLFALVDTKDSRLLAESKHKISNYMWSVVLKKDFSYKKSICSFFQKIVFYVSNQREIPQGIKNLYLLLGVFDKENVYHFGKEFLGSSNMQKSEWVHCFTKKDIAVQKAFVNCPLIFRNFIMENISSNTNLLKLRMLEQYDAGDAEAAMQSVTEILNINPVDLEGLYFGMATAYHAGNDYLLEIFTDLCNIFWSDNEEICELKEQICNK